MSITVTTDVFCDGPDCLAWINGVSSTRTQAAAARKEARRYGWSRRNGRDLCPECRQDRA
jgi:hypothetical protein